MRLLLMATFMAIIPVPVRAAVEQLVETFDGNGPYQSITNDLVGFDNPGWEVFSDDGFAAGGFHFQNDGELSTQSDALERIVSGVGSFVTYIELTDLDLSELDIDSGPASVAQVGILYRLHEDVNEGRNTLGFALRESKSLEPEWRFSRSVGSEGEVNIVPRGPRIAVTISFDYAASEVTFSYDNDTSDAVEPLVFQPMKYRGEIQETHLMTILSNSRESGYVDGVLDYLSVTPLSDVFGDFNANGILDAADIDQLSEQVREGTNDRLYDLNADALFNDLDRQFWVHDLKSTYFGDADLNGSFDSADLVQVLAFGEYEDGVELNSTWFTGDWDGDGDFTSGDLVTALADGGYETAAAVPEPSGALLLAMGLAALALNRQRS